MQNKWEQSAEDASMKRDGRGLDILHERATDTHAASKPRATRGSDTASQMQAIDDRDMKRRQNIIVVAEDYDHTYFKSAIATEN